MARITTRETDRGSARILALADVFSKRPIVTVGMQGKDAQATHPESSFTMVEILLINEFGLNGLPERSVIRWTMGNKAPQLQAAGKALFLQVLKGELAVDAALGRMGALILNLMRARIESNIPPALKWRTGIALKDTGRLENSFTFVTHPAGKQRITA